MTRVADPQVSFADLEFFTQGIDLDPILKRISDLLPSSADRKAGWKRSRAGSEKTRPGALWHDSAAGGALPDSHES